jgi:hypothetical protein
MGDEEFDILDDDEDDVEVTRSESEPLESIRFTSKRRLVEARLAQRNLDKLIQDYDFDLA